MGETEYRIGIGPDITHIEPQIKTHSWSDLIDRHEARISPRNTTTSGLLLEAKYQFLFNARSRMY